MAKEHVARLTNCLYHTHGEKTTMAATEIENGWDGHGFLWHVYPIGSMYGIFTNIYPKNHPNVGKYSINGSYGY